MRGEADGANGSSISPSRERNGISRSASHHNGHTAGALNGKAPSNGVSNSHSNGTIIRKDSHSAPTFYGHDREEVTRILIQALNDLGYTTTAVSLSRESGYDLETPYASAFRIAILHGEWDEAEALLSNTYVPDEGGGVEIDHGPRERDDQVISASSAATLTPPTGLSLSQEANKDEMLFLIRQQKYLELLERRDLGTALMVLRQELQPLHQNERQLHALSSLIMCQSTEDLKYQADWDGALGESRKRLLSELSRFISPSVMIPEHRLAELLTQVKEAQILNCPYHNTQQWPSLYTDHCCSPESLPVETIEVLNKHSNEVWNLQFSNDGTRLATASRDCTVVIYDTTTFEVVHILSEHGNSVAYAAWSPDDTMLVTCSQHSQPASPNGPACPGEAKLWNTKTGKCIRTMQYGENPVTTAAWAPDGQTFVVGSFDKERPLAIWPKDSGSDQPLFNFGPNCPRVQDCAISAVLPNRNSLRTEDENSQEYRSARPIRLVAVCLNKSIQVFDYVRREKLRHVVLDHAITCLNVSNDGHEMLISLKGDEVWIMGVEDCEIRRKFVGQKQDDFVIRSCFGGVRECFVVSGGADSMITIWHRHSGRLLQQLSGHGKGCVNGVAWNAARPTMFASAGDDNSVRIWSSKLSGRALPESPAGSGVIGEVDISEEGRPSDRSQAPPNWGSDSGGRADGGGSSGAGASSRGVVAALMTR